MTIPQAKVTAARSHTPTAEHCKNNEKADSGAYTIGKRRTADAKATQSALRPYATFFFDLFRFNRRVVKKKIDISATGEMTSMQIDRNTDPRLRPTTGS